MPEEVAGAGPEGPPGEEHQHRGSRQAGTVRQRAAARRKLEQQRHHHSAEGGQQKHADHGLPPQEAADHEHEGHVAEAQGFHPQHRLRDPAGTQGERGSDQSPHSAPGKPVQMVTLADPVGNGGAHIDLPGIPVDPQRNQLQIGDQPGPQEAQGSPPQRDFVGNHVTVEIDQRRGQQQQQQGEVIGEPPLHPVDRTSLDQGLALPANDGDRQQGGQPGGPGDGEQPPGGGQSLGVPPLAGDQSFAEPHDPPPQQQSERREHRGHRGE